MGMRVRYEETTFGTARVESFKATGSDAEALGVRVGDFIVAINKDFVAFANSEEVTSRLRKKDWPIDVLFVRPTQQSVNGQELLVFQKKGILEKKGDWLGYKARSAILAVEGGTSKGVGGNPLFAFQYSETVGSNDFKKISMLDIQDISDSGARSNGRTMTLKTAKELTFRIPADGSTSSEENTGRMHNESQLIAWRYCLERAMRISNGYFKVNPLIQDVNTDYLKIGQNASSDRDSQDQNALQRLQNAGRASLQRAPSGKLFYPLQKSSVALNSDAIISEDNIKFQDISLELLLNQNIPQLDFSLERSIAGK